MSKKGEVPDYMKNMSNPKTKKENPKSRKDKRTDTGGEEPVQKEMSEGKKRINELRDLYSKDKEETQHAKILFYGSWGTYKTTYACSMPRPILMQSFDPGGEKIFHVQKGEKDGSIIIDNRWASRTMENSEKRFRDWNKAYNKMKQDGVFEEIDTLVIDSLTTFQRFVIDATMEDNKKNKEIGKHMPFKVPQMRDYNVQHAAIEFIISDMLDLPCNVVIIAHSEEGQDNDTNLFYCHPLIIGSKLRERLPMLFDEIYITKQQGSTIELLTAPKGYRKARSRLRKLSPEIEDSYKIKGINDFSFSRDILYPSGYCTEEEIVELEPFPE